MSAGAMDDTGTAEARGINAARLTEALCDEFGAAQVAAVAASVAASAPPDPWTGVEQVSAVAYPVQWVQP